MQKSNDNFSSNIVDITGCQVNISGDSVQTFDSFYKSCNVFFIIENLNSEYLRVVARSYATANEVRLHRNDFWDGGSGDVYFNPTLMVAEV